MKLVNYEDIQNVKAGDEDAAKKVRELASSKYLKWHEVKSKYVEDIYQKIPP